MSDNHTITFNLADNSAGSGAPLPDVGPDPVNPNPPSPGGGGAGPGGGGGGSGGGPPGPGGGSGGPPGPGGGPPGGGGPAGGPTPVPPAPPGGGGPPGPGGGPAGTVTAVASTIIALIAIFRQLTAVATNLASALGNIPPAAARMAFGSGYGLMGGVSTIASSTVRAATSLIPFPGVSDVAGIAVSSFFRTIEEIKQGVKAIEESVEGLSPDVAVSSAENQIRILEHLLYRADVIGEDLGETVRMRGQLEAIWIDISTNLTKAIMPDLKAVLQALLTISRMIELISRNTPAMTDVIDAIQVALTVTFPAAAVQVAQMLDFLEIISELLKKSEVDIDANTLADIQKFLLNPIPDHVRYGGGTKFTPPAAAGAAGAAGAGGP